MLVSLAPCGRQEGGTGLEPGRAGGADRGKEGAARPPVEAGGTSWQGDVYTRRTGARRTVVRRTGTRTG